MFNEDYFGLVLPLKEYMLTFVKIHYTCDFDILISSAGEDFYIALQDPELP